MWTELNWREGDWWQLVNLCCSQYSMDRLSFIRGHDREVERVNSYRQILILCFLPTRSHYSFFVWYFLPNPCVPCSVMEMNSCPDRFSKRKRWSLAPFDVFPSSINNRKTNQTSTYIFVNITRLRWDPTQSHWQSPWIHRHGIHHQKLGEDNGVWSRDIMSLI